ncbi:hypothetical protein [Frondihabitans sp. 762G35]|uniref:hypothetical protein n=1 Tax=Frondihabitans sp. 762G35 TaxID=1446794 RepID=UPI000F4D5BAD|nr:hypothetical protein [Frondihabitans sp. 762G35]
MTALNENVLAYVLGMFLSLDAYRDADAARFTTAVVPRMEAGQLRAAQLTDAYMARSAAGLLGGSIVRGLIVDVSFMALRHVAGELVMRRPFTAMYTELANGGTMTDAVEAAKHRLTSIVYTNQQLAKTHSATNALERSGVPGFERFLTGRENCSLCVVASTQRYHSGQLLPIHPGCDCGVRPILSLKDEQVIHPDRLAAIHAAVDDHTGVSDPGAREIDRLNPRSDYLDLIATRTHGEIGPVLTWRDQHFTSLSQIQDTP